MHIPKTNNIPNLSALNKPVILDKILNQVFGRVGKAKNLAEPFLSGFIVTVDKVIFEYESARKCLDRSIDQNCPWTNYFRCLFHFEACINSIRRVFGFFDRLKSFLRTPWVEKETRKFIKKHYDNIRKMRNTIEHIYNNIQEVVKKGDPVALAITDDEKSIQISCHIITFNQLELVIRKLHTIATNLAIYDEGS